MKMNKKNKLWIHEFNKLMIDMQIKTDFDWLHPAPQKRR